MNLYWTDVSELREDARRLSLLPFLSEFRQAAESRRRSPDAKAASAGVELLLREAVRRRCGRTLSPCDILRRPDGMTCVAGLPLFISLSHSGTLALCLLSETPVGADLERHRRVSPGMVRRFFPPLQAAQWSALDPAMQTAEFFRLWTAKEADCKRAGIPLIAALRQNALPADGKNPAREGDINYKWFSIAGDYTACICSPAPIEAFPAAPEFISLASAFPAHG